MRLCELAEYFDKYSVLGPSELDKYILSMKKVKESTNSSLESILNNHPLCITHKDITSDELRTLLAQLEAEDLWTPNFNQVNLALGTCSYELELFKVKFLGYIERKAIFQFKDRKVSTYYSTKNKLEVNKDYLILADFYYTVSGIADCSTYLSVHDVIEINSNIEPYFKDYSETHFKDIYLCHPLSKKYRKNIGLAVKCKTPRRDRVYKAVINKDFGLLTKDDIRDLCVGETE